jgi:hypothetical protein
MGEAVKLCGRCKVEQSIDNFDTYNRGAIEVCKPCRRERGREYYKRSRPHIKEWIYDYLSSNPCVDCGENDPLRLEFDHRSEKHFNIGKSFIGKAKNIEIVQSEIAKCDVRCANCHKVKTHKEQDTWKYRMSVERNQ